MATTITKKVAKKKVAKKKVVKKKEKVNFECTICEPGKAVFGSKAALSAHVNRGHLKKIEDSDFVMSSKEARPKLYHPEWGKKKNKNKKKAGGSVAKKQLAKKTTEQKQGMIEIPIILRIPFHFEIPQIVQDDETQTIELS